MADIDMSLHTFPLQSVVCKDFIERKEMMSIATFSDDRYGYCFVMHGYCFVMHGYCFVMHGYCFVMCGYCFVMHGYCL